MTTPTLREALEAVARIRARFPHPTGTNWHWDLDLIERALAEPEPPRPPTDAEIVQFVCDAHAEGAFGHDDDAVRFVRRKLAEWEAASRDEPRPRQQHDDATNALITEHRKRIFGDLRPQGEPPRDLAAGPPVVEGAPSGPWRVIPNGQTGDNAGWLVDNAVDETIFMRDEQHAYTVRDALNRVSRSTTPKEGLDP